MNEHTYDLGVNFDDGHGCTCGDDYCGRHETDPEDLVNIMLTDILTGGASDEAKAEAVELVRKMAVGDIQWISFPLGDGDSLDPEDWEPEDSTLKVHWKVTRIA